LSVINPPTITKVNKKIKGYTKITFTPDYKWFGINFTKEKFGKDLLKLVKKRAYDLSACVGNSVSVYYNNQLISFKNFKDYAKLYITPDDPLIEYNIDRWNIVITNSLDDSFNQISFVNGVCTLNGGKHVEYIVSQITKYIKDKMINKSEKYSILSSVMIKNLLFVFINSIINTPSFCEQSKNTLSTDPKDFGSTCVLPEEFLQKIMKKMEISKKCEALLNAKNEINLQKTVGKRKRKYLLIIMIQLFIQERQKVKIVI
jgi:DNA topoisomerase-2